MPCFLPCFLVVFFGWPLGLLVSLGHAMIARRFPRVVQAARRLGEIPGNWDLFRGFFAGTSPNSNMEGPKMMVWRRWTPLKYGHFWYLC